MGCLFQKMLKKKSDGKTTFVRLDKVKVKIRTKNRPRKSDATSNTITSSASRK